MEATMSIHSILNLDQDNTRSLILARKKPALEA
jgi:hypothetical protein